MKKYILITAIIGFCFAGVVAQNETEPSKPVRKVLIEEFTGTWCGNCPRGYVALKWIAKDYGDRQISVSYHIDDVLDVAGASYYGIRSVPECAVDRGPLIDPYYGTPGFPVDLGIYYDIDLALEEEAICSIDIEVEEAGTLARVTPHIRFIKDVDNCKYQMGYVLKADSASSHFYPQENYYAGVKETEGTPLEEVSKWPSIMRGLMYHDVAIDVTGYKGINGSLPSRIVADADYTPTFNINFGDSRLFSYKNQLSAVVFVIDKSTGRILNANSYHFGQDQENAAVNHIASASEVTGVEYYDLSGRKISNPDKGIFIRIERLSDGSARTEKIVL